MRRLSFTFTLFAVACLVVAPNAFGSILWQTLVGGSVTTYEDQSREVIINLDGNTQQYGASSSRQQLTVGDVIAGWLRIDDRVIPTGAAVPDGDLYIMFTSQVSKITGTDIDPGVGVTNVYQTEFIPTTVPGLRLKDIMDLSGLGLTAAEISNSAAAIFEDVGLNMITTAPALGAVVPGDKNIDGSFDILDFWAQIESGNLDVVAGFDNPPPVLGDGPDFWSSGSVPLPEAVDVVSDLSLLNSFIIQDSVGTTFDVGLSNFYDASGNLLENVPVTDPLTGNKNLHGLGVTNGNVSGASDVSYAGTLGNPYTNGFTSTDVDDGVRYTFTDAQVFAAADNANVSLFSVVPEPLSVLVWSVLAGIGLGFGGRKYRHQQLLLG